MIAEKILGHINDYKGMRVDRVILDHLSLAKPHQKVKSEEGMEIGISLPHGMNLFHGAVIYFDEEKIVAIDMVLEDVIEIYPKGNLQWAKVAFNAGNMHHPTYLYEDSIQVPYDEIIERMIKSMGVSYARCERKLTGIKANHVGHNNSHK